jgi:hypothetical protein
VKLWNKLHAYGKIANHFITGTTGYAATTDNNTQVAATGKHDGARERMDRTLWSIEMVTSNIYGNKCKYKLGADNQASQNVYLPLHQRRDIHPVIIPVVVLVTRPVHGYTNHMQAKVR